MLRLLTILFITTISVGIKAQNISISANGTPADSSAILHLKGVDKGLLIPRMTTNQRTAIQSPAHGLMVYDVQTKNIWQYHGEWFPILKPDHIPVIQMISDTFMLIGPHSISGVPVDDLNYWNKSGVDVSIDTGQVGIGVMHPQAALHMRTDTFNAVQRYDNRRSQITGTIDTSSTLIPVAVSQNSLGLNWPNLNLTNFISSDDQSQKSPDFTYGAGSAKNLQLTFAPTVPIPLEATLTNLRFRAELKMEELNQGSGGFIHMRGIFLRNNGMLIAHSDHISPIIDDTSDIIFVEQFRKIGTFNWSDIGAEDINNGQLSIEIYDVHGHGTESIRLAIDAVQLQIEFTEPAVGNEDVSWTTGVENGKFKIANSDDLSNKTHFSISETGRTSLKEIQITEDAAYGKILTSNTNGIGTWRYPNELGLNDNFGSQLQYIEMFNDTMMLFEFPEPGDDPGNIGGFIPAEDIRIWEFISDTFMYDLGAIFINNDDNPAVVFDQGQSAIRNSQNILTTERQNLNLLLDTDNNQSNSNFALYRDSANSLGNAIVNLNLNQNDSWINSGDFGFRTLSPLSDVHLVHGTSNDEDGFRIEHQTTGNHWRFFVTGNGNLNLYNSNSPGSPIGSFNLTTGAYSALSDERMKTNSSPLTGVLEKVTSLNPLTYQMTTQLSDKSRHLGFLAQEVREIFPEVVQYHEEEDRYTMDYSSFGVIAIQAIKEQQEQIDRLEKLVQDLLDHNSQK